MLLIDWFAQVATIGKETQRNSDDIKQMRREVDDLIRAVERLAYEIKRTQENEKHEREKLGLVLKNELLMFEKRLPSGDKG